MQDAGGKNQLLIYRYCFDYILKVPTSGGSSNTRQKRNQSQAKNKRHSEKAMASGRRKVGGLSKNKCFRISN